ncbi:MAG: S-layer homology domain-containing protein [Clostridia bacterium]
MKKLNNILKKITVMFCVLTLSVMSLPIGSFVNAENVYLNVKAANPYKVNMGGTMTCNFEYAGDISSIWLVAGAITLNGFTANKSIGTEYVSGNKKIVPVSFVNIQGTPGKKSITVTGGTAMSSDGKLSNPSNYVAEFELVQPAPQDNIAPVLRLSAPNPSAITAGETVTYTATYTDNVKISSVWLVAGAITLNGFTGNKMVRINGNSATITITNIRGSIGSKSITVTGGTAMDTSGNLSNPATSPAFNIVEKSKPIDPVIPPKPEKPVDPGNPTQPNKPNQPAQPAQPAQPNKPNQPITSRNIVQNNQVVVTSTCDDKNLGDINEEITYFASWLRAEKYTKSVVQENNYAAKDETMVYMVEYYNGSTAPTPNVKFTLTIPKGAIIEEINGNGKVVEQKNDKTVVEWNVGKVEVGVGCRLFVRVKYLSDETLEKSKDINKEFYSELLTNANGNTSYSYMRQLFIDRSVSKTGTLTKYLMALDTTNAIRPDAEITRAEFAKLLADCGILKIEAGSNKYKTFKDADKIPEYARDAVSALIGTDIIQAFPDGTFKPENPIIREDLMQMVASAARYISETKLTVTKPVFIYKDLLKDKDGKLVANKDFIMELMRQNVIPKYASAVRPDDYTKRLEAVTIINSLTFRGPFVQSLPKDTMKFTDIMDHKYFYDLVGASNTYEYNYDYRLWQNILAVK